MKKLLFTIVALLLPLVASANYSEKYSSNSWSHVGCDATINGIHYLLNSSNQTATVTYRAIIDDDGRNWPVNDYSGDVVIPSQVPYGGVNYTVTGIDDGAFDFTHDNTYGPHPSSWTPVTSISIPNTVTSIGMGAFKNCTSLSSIIIPSGVASIGDETFNYCSSLKSVNLPYILSSIGESAFQGCIGLQSIILPNNLTSIGNTAFYGCTSLTAITIPDNVTTIGDNAFVGCSKLASVTLGYYLSNIGKKAFCKCGMLNNLYCYAPVPPSLDGDLSNKPFDDEMIYGDEIYLYVPSSSLNAYYVSQMYGTIEGGRGWSMISTTHILPLSNQTTGKLTTPTITMTNGVLKFDCGTDGAEYHYSITYPESNSNTIGNDVQVPQAYVVSVYAVKAGYDKSDTATKQFTITNEVRGDLTNDGKVNAADHVELSNIILGSND